MAADNQPQGQGTRPVLIKPRDRSRQAAPQVSDLLRARILSLELVPGTVLLCRPVAIRAFIPCCCGAKEQGMGWKVVEGDHNTKHKTQ